MRLVERDTQLAALARTRDRLPQGGVVLLGAEAGAGKTSLLRAFLAEGSADLVVRSGRCDELSTPVSYAPLWDMLDDLPDTVRQALAGDGRHAVVSALTDALREGPTVLVIDDAQWADEATIDLIRHLGRRVDDIPVMLCLAYRSDEVDATHPLRTALGELTHATRIDLPALTLAGVRSLAAGSHADVTRVYARSGGNPFFVTEMLAAPDAAVSGAIGDAVLARATRLPASAWVVLDHVALSPAGVPLSLLPTLGPDAEHDADLAIGRGLLEITGSRIRCRHDLVRTTLATTIPPLRRRRAHQSLVDALAPVATSTADIAQVAAHAVAAGDDAQAADFSLRAADRAAADGAHREAVRHLTHVLERRAHLTDAQIDHALEACAQEAYYTHDLDRALACALEYREHARERPAREQGRRTLWASRLALYAGEDDRAERLAGESVELFSTAGDPLQNAYARWWRAMLVDDVAESRRVGAEAAALARASGDDAIAAHILVGAYGTDDGPDDVVARMEEGLALARRAGVDEQAARAYCNAAYLTVTGRRLDEADRWLAEGLEWTWGHDLMFWWDAMIDSRAMARLFRGDWDAALDDCGRTIDGRRALQWQVCAACTRATILLRRGDPDAADAAAFADTTATGAWHDALLAAAVHAEAAWMTGADPAQALEVLAADGDSGSPPSPWHIGGVAFWLAKIDPAMIPSTARVVAPEPIARELDGDLAAAASAWRALGCEFEAAVLDGLSDDPDRIREALTSLARLGADATIDRLRRGAAERGVRVIPRGARAATVADPDGLTPRQVEILRLLGDRLTDAEIADRLYLSERTVGHHVSAILQRLGVRSRREAGAHSRARFDTVESAD